MVHVSTRFYFISNLELFSFQRRRCQEGDVQGPTEHAAPLRRTLLRRICCPRSRRTWTHGRRCLWLRRPAATGPWRLRLQLLKSASLIFVFASFFFNQTAFKEIKDFFRRSKPLLSSTPDFLGVKNSFVNPIPSPTFHLKVVMSVLITFSHLVLFFPAK